MSFPGWPERAPPPGPCQGGQDTPEGEGPHAGGRGAVVGGGFLSVVLII